MMTNDQLSLVNDVGIAGLAIVSTLSTMWLRHYLQIKQANKHNKLDEMDAQLDEANEIYAQLNSMRVALKCDRINIFQFHNGERFVGTNDSFKRLSNTFETCSPGISSEAATMQSLPVSLCSMCIKYLMQNPYLHAKNVEDCPPLKGNINLIRSRGVKSIYKVPVFNLQNRMIAYMSAEWVFEEHDYVEEEVAKMQEIASLISGYLHTSYKV